MLENGLLNLFHVVSMLWSPKFGLQYDLYDVIIKARMLDASIALLNYKAAFNTLSLISYKIGQGCPDFSPT